MVRTALFNWAYARHTGGTFVFRIEDTDSARDSEESYDALLGALRWLGLNWDEGPVVGGPYGPYRQSERMDLYADVARRLVEGGYAYRCYCSADELQARREAAMAAGRAPGYDGHCRDLTTDQVAAFVAEDREPVIRFRMPGHDFTWDDLVRGDVTFTAENVTDYVLVRANGEPLYTLVNPVDDALMRITHVLRGEDLLSSTPRQLALYEALAAIGVSDGTTPRFGHLPYVMGEGNAKLSKRDPQSSLQMYRGEGYLPEALLNYLALLGWSMGEDREFFSLEEMAQAFDLSRVSPNPARFDLKKCTAINGDWIRALSPGDLKARIIPFLASAGFISDPPDEGQSAILDAVVPLIQERLETLGQVPEMVGFLFVSAADLPAGEMATLDSEAHTVLGAAERALDSVGDWTATAIQESLRGALVDGLGLKPKVAFGPVRIAITGRRVSPPLFESMEILGRDESCARIRRARDL
jgi:glutamyl-tRNA synthetase